MEEKNGIQTHFQHLKTRMNKFRDVQGRRLNELTKNANSAKSNLKDRISLAERILKMAELGRKMETEQEKVVPFYVSSVESEIEKQAEDMVKAQKESNDGRDAISGDGEATVTPLTSSSWTTGGKPVSKWNILDNFWKKYNKVLLDALTISKEEARLKGENADLQEILKQYLDGISVNDEVIKRSNPLMVVNGRVNLNRPLPVRKADARGLTVVDANSVVATQQRVNR